MTDLEMTKLCAEAMGLGGKEVNNQWRLVMMMPLESYVVLYDPLHDDAQAMALVEKFELWIDKHIAGDIWNAHVIADTGPTHMGESENLNRAIVECVAKMQKEKP